MLDGLSLAVMTSHQDRQFMQSQDPPAAGASAFASYQGAALFMQSAVHKALATGDARAAAWVRTRERHRPTCSLAFA